MGALVLALLVGACTGSSKTGSAAPVSSDSAAPGASGQGSGDSAAPNQAPVPKENNPPGDIPDNQAFVSYKSSTGGFTLKTPEGWARTDAADRVTFTNQLNSIEVRWTTSSEPPSMARAQSTDVPRLQRTRLAYQLGKVSAVSLPGGSAVRIDGTENSAPNDVTGKQYRLEVLRFEFGQGTRQAELALSSPAGADNVDVWKLVSESFRWA